MAEEKRPDSGDPSPPPSLGQFDTDWGADWESAFQSEEKESPTEVSADLFAPSEATTPAEDSPAGAAPAGDQSLERMLDGIPGQESAGPGARRRIIPWASEAVASLLAFGRALPLLFRRDETSPLRKLGRRFTALSPLRQMLVAGLALLLIAGLALFLRAGGRQAELAISDDPTALQLAQEADIFPPREIPPETTTPALPLAIPPAPEIVRHKWPFPGFLIPVTGKDDLEVALVRVDLTLLLQLPAGQEPPLAQEALVRDRLYNFYLAQSPDKLRRYSLARGEMLRDLREWLNQQLPDLAVESINFDRYAIN